MSAHEPTVYLVANDFGQAGRAWREADLETTNLETVIQDLLVGDIAGRSRSSPSTWRALVREGCCIAAICN
jgi:hypothetical protein